MYILTDHELRRRLARLAGKTHKSLTMDGYHRAGVLVPIVFGLDEPMLLFTKRTETVETHKGQVSFPGGMMDPEDADLVKTALREAWEEVGIPETVVTVMGVLEDFATPTGFVITPVVGIIERLPDLTPNVHEVADVFQVPIGFFATPGNARSEVHDFRGVRREVWYYQSGNHTIWGATAMIVRSLLNHLDLV